MADNLNLKHQINVPFAETGNKYNIPDTSSDGSVDMNSGLGKRYEIPPAKGGLYTKPELFNSIFYPLYAAVKELQDLAIAAGFPIDMTKALNVLDNEHGGTGNTVGRATSIESIFGYNFIQKIGLAAGTYTTAEFCNALTQNSIYFPSGQIIVTWIYKSGQATDDIFITDLPYDICCLEIKKFDVYRLTLTAYNPVTYDRAIGVYTSSSQFQGWKKLINYEGLLADNTVSSNAIQNGAVTDAKISSISASKISGGPEITQVQQSIVIKTILSNNKKKVEILFKSHTGNQNIINVGLKIGRFIATPLSNTSTSVKQVSINDNNVIFFTDTQNIECYFVGIEK